MLKIVTDVGDGDDLVLALDDLVAEGARRMLVAALEVEVAEYVDRHVGEVDEAGRRLVVRNGRAGERTLVTGAGGLRVRAPRVHDRREGRSFSSYILPRYARRSPKVADVTIEVPRSLTAASVLAHTVPSRTKHVARVGRRGRLHRAALRSCGQAAW